MYNTSSLYFALLVFSQVPAHEPDLKRQPGRGVLKEPGKSSRGRHIEAQQAQARGPRFPASFAPDAILKFRGATARYSCQSTVTVVV